jgi:hypothetical protein
VRVRAACVLGLLTRSGKFWARGPRDGHSLGGWADQAADY